MRFELLGPLRGVAAIWVLALHYNFSESFSARFSSLDILAEQGEMGVAMFFVISGYCLMAASRSTGKRRVGVRGFLARRIVRIFPPFWCSIIVVAAVPFVVELLSSFKTGSYEWPDPSNPNLGYINYDLPAWARVATLTQAFLPTGQTIGGKFNSINAVYWSLAIEVQFYVIVALSLWSKRQSSVLLAVSALSIPFAVFESTYRSGFFLPWWPMFAWGLLLYRVLETGRSPRLVFKRWSGRCSAVAALLILTGFLAWVELGNDLRQHAFAFFFAIALWFLSDLDESFKQLLASGSPGTLLAIPAKVLAFIGVMSYSVYLIHGRMQYLSLQLATQIVEYNSIARDALVLTVTLALCYPFFAFCEAPFINPKLSNFESGRSRS